jgi:hypothetical protein
VGEAVDLVETGAAEDGDTGRGHGG